MKCEKRTAKLRDAGLVCFMEGSREDRRYKDIESTDEIKRLPFEDFIAETTGEDAKYQNAHYGPPSANRDSR